MLLLLIVAFCICILAGEALVWYREERSIPSVPPVMSYYDEIAPLAPADDIALTPNARSVRRQESPAGGDLPRLSDAA